MFFFVTRFGSRMARFCRGGQIPCHMIKIVIIIETVSNREMTRPILALNLEYQLGIVLHYLHHLEPGWLRYDQDQLPGWL